MQTIKSNKLIPILGIVLLICVAGVIFKSRSTSQQENAPVALKEVPKPAKPSADGDTTADTVRTLTETVNKTKDEVAKLREDAKTVKEKDEEVLRNKGQITEDVTRRLTEQFNRPDASGSPVFSGLSSRIEDVANRLERYTAGAMPGATGPGTGDIPGGLGFEKKPGGVTPGMVGPQAGADAGQPQMVWVEPFGTRTVMGPNGQPQMVRTAFSPQTPGQNPPGQNQNPGVVSNPGGVYGPNPGAASATVLDANGQPIPNELQPAPPVAAEVAKPTVKPYFTIPENSTLIGSTAMTALVGRVPVNGKVTDAMPFKVLIGRTNLAANGLDVPDDVSGMVVSGIAVGDWGLSCTQGYVQSVTFLFNDGSIKTVSQRTGGAFTTNVGNSASTGGGIASTQKIGWISDKRGVPCITGKRISNAPSYLSTTVGLKALEVGAKAAALSQTTTTANPLGGASSAVTGNSTDFILGSTVAGGVNEISDWIKQRLNNSFDAVYVEPGFEVAVHIDQELQLDKAPEARRLDYGRVNAQRRTGNGNARLD